MNYTYTFNDKRKINMTTERMATVIVHTLMGKEIGRYSWSKLSDRFKEQDIKNMVDILIREYEMRLCLTRVATR